MARLRRDVHDTQLTAQLQRPLRIVASGTLFVTHTLSIPSYPAPSTVIRAHAVSRVRGGSASNLLSLLAQFPSVEALLVAPLAGNDEGTMILRDLEKEGVITRYCKVWKGAGVPSAWVLHAGDSDTRTVVNHNPLPEITHEDFVSILGPLLAPENYLYSPPPFTPTPPSGGSSPRPASPPSLPRTSTQVRYNPNSPAPFDWLHFEGRSVKTTLSNITGLDGLARERKWRSHCVFSVDVGRKSRQGVEALIPHADVLFLNKHYAQASSPNYASSPRAFLLSLTSIVSPHALLVAHWGSEGAAVLSLPTKEYFQSSGWVEDRRQPEPAREPVNPGNRNGRGGGEEFQSVQSVRTGSDFWAGHRSRTPSSSAFTAGESSGGTRDMSTFSHSHTHSQSQSRSGHGHHRHHDSREHGEGDRDGNEDEDEEGDNDSQGTEVPGDHDGRDVEDDGVLDEVGAQDAFVAGMIYAMSRRIAPGPPYTPASGGEDTRPNANSSDAERGRWRLDECLRFATELAGRKARRRNWDGLADEMIKAGWFDN